MEFLTIQEILSTRIKMAEKSGNSTEFAFLSELIRITKEYKIMASFVRDIDELNRNFKNIIKK